MEEEKKEVKNILMDIRNKSLPVDIIDIILDYSHIFQFEKNSFYSFKEDGYCHVINKTKKYLHFIIRNDNPSNFTPYKGIKCFKSKIEYDNDGNEFVNFKSSYSGKNTEWFIRHIYRYVFTTLEERREISRLFDKNNILSYEKITDNCESFLEYHNKITYIPNDTDEDD
jgi:hypothetical protein